MNRLLALPIEMRLFTCFVLGAIVASFLNLAVYRMAWNQRLISPWSPAPKGGVRKWLDRVPIFGWLALRREEHLHGRWFWIRPMAIEIATGLAFAALYWWEIVRLGLLRHPMFVAQQPPGSLLKLFDNSAMHWMLVSHWVLLSLMIVASFIDIDEKTIPDEVTLPGTLIGLALAAAFPWSLLPGVQLLLLPRSQFVEFLQIASPYKWNVKLSGGPPNYSALALGLGCYWLWCFALLPRTWHGRYGLRRACAYFLAKIVRERFSYLIAVVAFIGTVAITLMWWNAGPSWIGTLTSLVGVATGAVMIWSVRLIGRAVLQKEAMGFGDVTLMAMIGSFVGWQACLVVFFLAPLAGLVVGVLQWLMIRENTIPFGPFLCLATTVTVVYWSAIWFKIGRIFELGKWIPVILVGCLAAMAVLLALLQILKLVFRRPN